MRELLPEQELKEVIPNIALMLERNAGLYADRIVYQEKHGGKYYPIKWKELYEDIQNIASNLRKYGFKKGDKIVVYSPNRLEMLQLELAVMASGGVSVPIFAYFVAETAELLIKHSDARFLAVAGELQLGRIDENLPLEHIFIFDDARDSRFRNLSLFSDLLEEREDKNFSLSFDADSDEVCLNMYTSGTMGTPKCVQLMHKNILSQQAALSDIWDLDENDRFLSYLPWHHSFGGIFERFSALYNGAMLSLESGYGKKTEVILENWELVKPTVFFSVPIVYQSLVDMVKGEEKLEKMFFNSGLKFVFTAAAPLSANLSDEFESRNIPVIEGWGLTETSPCCTLTNPKVKRKSGVVGKPIPGVKIRLGDDDEIQVKGPNVMLRYYKNDEANEGIFTEDGWFCTGDVGEITEDGLKLVSRKDRIFKLANGEKVIPTDMESVIHGKCHYISFALVVGGGKDYPVALLFPKRNLLGHPDYEISPIEGCFCPRDLAELGKCLHGCLNDANCGIGQKFAKIKAAMLIDEELSIENNTLTPSMKLAPKKVTQVFKAHLENLYGADNEIKEEVYVIRLDEQAKMKV